MYKMHYKDTQMRFASMNVILLYSERRHVSATHVAILILSGAKTTPSLTNPYHNPPHVPVMYISTHNNTPDNHF
jgi:hypothetical protein